VPQEIREACGVEPGSELLFTKVGEHRFECRVLPQPGSLMEFIKQHQIDGPPIDVEQLIREGEEQAADEFIERLNRNRK
jgi:bifunctional DNA-binding transcriptional regulator/antitoxin component of YhaV-PrlF toxin-antitoxin module